MDKLVGQLGLLWLRPGVACAGGGGVWGFSAWCGVQWCVVHGGCEPFFILLKSCFEHGKLLGNKKSERERKNQAAYRRLGANVLL